MDIREILAKIVYQLHDRNLNVVSKATDISVPTLKSIQTGEHINPTLRVIEALNKYFEGK